MVFVAEGVWQGDGCSPLFFCLATTPVIRNELTRIQQEWVELGHPHPTALPHDMATQEADLPLAGARGPDDLKHCPANTATDLASFMDDHNCFFSFSIDFTVYSLQRFTSQDFAIRYPDISFAFKKFAIHASAFVNDDIQHLQTMLDLLPTGNVDSPSHLVIASTAAPPSNSSVNAVS